MSGFDIGEEESGAYVVGTEDEPAHSVGLSLMTEESTIDECSSSMLRQAKLARFVFDCKKVSDDSFAALLKRGLELFNRTEVDVVKIFAVRLERADAWTFGSDVPLPQMRDGIIKWLVGLAEKELGAELGFGE